MNTTTNTRNDAGVKWSSDLYRTFDGARYVCFTAGNANDEMVAKLRGAGVRCRKAAGEVFVHVDDVNKAQEVA